VLHAVFKVRDFVLCPSGAQVYSYEDIISPACEVDFYSAGVCSL
jgi:hypothetical protein